MEWDFCEIIVGKVSAEAPSSIAAEQAEVLEGLSGVFGDVQDF